MSRQWGLENRSYAFKRWSSLGALFVVEGSGRRGVAAVGSRQCGIDGVVDKQQESRTAHLGMASEGGRVFGSTKKHERGEVGIWRLWGRDEVDDVGIGRKPMAREEEGWPCWLVNR